MLEGGVLIGRRVINHMESLTGTFWLFRIQLLIEAQQGIKNMAIETGLPSVFTKKTREEGVAHIDSKAQKVGAYIREGT